MKTPNERISDLERSLAAFDAEMDALARMIPWAFHKALEGLLDAKKISYLEKRLIWESVSKEIQEHLGPTRLSASLGHRLKEIGDYSQRRH